MAKQNEYINENIGNDNRQIQEIMCLTEKTIF